MADPTVFDFAAAQLEQHTSLDKLAARGTVRLALKSAGLDPSAVGTRHMLVVLKSVLPDELQRRGVEDAATVCQSISEALVKAGLSSEATDGADRAAAIFARLGTG
ncbi:hypothetical protein KJ059_02910 [Myxococcota bacterium]|nr:hypothetical protein [Myxococcota bacterium]MCZ7618257.1 hypothetical protein [Myxococcota bacterium]